MTVSLCLREDKGEGRISGETRERVLNAVRELGYRPNINAKRLRSGRSNVIALYAGHGYLNVRSPYFAEIVSGLQEGCEIARKDLLLHSAFHTAPSNDLLPELLNGRVDGLIVDMYPNDPLRPRLVEADLFAVAISNELEGLPSVVVDDASGGRMIAKHLFEAGHRKIAYVVGDVEPLSGLNRRLAFLEAAADLGIQATVTPVDTEEDWGVAVNEAIDAGVTAMACWNDTYAREALVHLVRMGIDVPGKVAVTGFDGCPVPVIERFALTTIAAPWYEVAKSAVMTLSARLAGEAVPPKVVYPVRFIRGETS